MKSGNYSAELQKKGKVFLSNYCPESVTAGKIMGLILKEDAKLRVCGATEL